VDIQLPKSVLQVAELRLRTKKIWAFPPLLL
jgi:hypothetical protein